jgi:hypothetical protein
MSGKFLISRLVRTGGINMFYKDYSKERTVAIDAVLTASKVCQSVFQHLVANETLTKNDKSPVTGKTII